jgi:hypothetical protein
VQDPPVPATSTVSRPVTTSATDWHHRHAIDHTGAVWVRVTPDPANAGAAHRVTLRWGPDLRRVELPALGPEPISLVHRKTPMDRTVLLVEVEPAANVAFGEGLPPYAPAIDVTDGWVRSAADAPAAASAPAPVPAPVRAARLPAPVSTPAGRAVPGSAPTPRLALDPVRYHVRLHRLMGDAEAFNLSRDEVVDRFVRPWLSGHTVTLAGRVWSPERTRMIIYAGPPLTTNQRALDQGWVNAMKLGEDVTAELLSAG